MKYDTCETKTSDVPTGAPRLRSLSSLGKRDDDGRSHGERAAVRPPPPECCPAGAASHLGAATSRCHLHSHPFKENMWCWQYHNVSVPVALALSSWHASFSFSLPSTDKLGALLKWSAVEQTPQLSSRTGAATSARRRPFVRRPADIPVDRKRVTTSSSLSASSASA